MGGRARSSLLSFSWGGGRSFVQPAVSCQRRKKEKKRKGKKEKEKINFFHPSFPNPARTCRQQNLVGVCKQDFSLLKMIIGKYMYVLVPYVWVERGAVCLLSQRQESGSSGRTQQGNSQSASSTCFSFLGVGGCGGGDGDGGGSGGSGGGGVLWLV